MTEGMASGSIGSEFILPDKEGFRGKGYGRGEKMFHTAWCRPIPMLKLPCAHLKTSLTMESTELHDAANCGDDMAVKALLEQGGNPNAFDDMAFTPLHHAVQNGRFEIVALLLQAGADVNAHDEERIGDTPLGYVAGNCSLEMAQALVSGGADPTIRGWMQLSALDRAKERKREEGQRVYALLCKAASRFSGGS